MRGLYCFVLWMFSSAKWPGSSSTGQLCHLSQLCHLVPDTCTQEKDVLWCIEQNMRTCCKPKSRLSTPNYFMIALNSSQKTLAIKEEYMINISDEALKRSLNGQEGDDNVELKVYLLDKTYFREGNGQNGSDPVLHGQSVLGVWLGKNEVHNLSQPVQLKFKNINQTEHGMCVYWHLHKNGRGTWRTDGCKTSVVNGDFVCSCNHLSFFAVLINPQIPEEAHIVHLNYISYIGSALSIAFTALMIVLFLCQRRKQTEHSVIIHVQLSGSLFLLHISFLSSVWLSGHRHNDSVACPALGLFLHWCLLTTFTWTAIEGFHLYLLLVRVFNIYIKRYLLKLSLVGWGVPSIAVMICGVSKAYGKYTFYTDRENSTFTPLCWVATQTVSYISVNGYLGLVLIFNTAILVVAMVKMRQLRSRVKDRERRAWRDWASLLGLSCVLGVPWGLAFSTHGPMSLPALYVFTILNSFQGVFIFLWFLTLTCQARKEKEISSKGTIQISFHSNDDYVTTKLPTVVR